MFGQSKLGPKKNWPGLPPLKAVFQNFSKYFQMLNVPEILKTRFLDVSEENKISKINGKKNFWIFLRDSELITFYQIDFFVFLTKFKKAISRRFKHKIRCPSKIAIKQLYYVLHTGTPCQNKSIKMAKLAKLAKWTSFEHFREFFDFESFKIATWPKIRQNLRILGQFWRV